MLMKVAKMRAAREMTTRTGVKMKMKERFALCRTSGVRWVWWISWARQACTPRVSYLEDMPSDRDTSDTRRLRVQMFKEVLVRHDASSASRAVASRTT